MSDAMTTFASNALTTFTPTRSKVIVPCVKISSARIAASAPSRASPAGLACPCARPTIDSPGAHSSDTSQVTWPDGDRVNVKPVNRSRSRRTTAAASTRDPLGAPSLDIGVNLAEGSLDPRREERQRPAGLRARSQYATSCPSPRQRSFFYSVDRQFQPHEGGPTVTDVTGDVR